MLEAAAKSAGIHDLLDEIISVEEVKIFKPSPRVYNLAPERLKVTNTALGFVSANNWDATGAASAGLRSVAAGSHHRRRGAGWQPGYCGSPHWAVAVGETRPAIHRRKQDRRGHQWRYRGSREGASGRVHAALGRRGEYDQCDTLRAAQFRIC